MGLQLEEVAGKRGGKRMDDYLRRKVRYSLLTYLQKKAAEQISKLPKDFNELGKWESFRKELVEKLKETLGIPQISLPTDSKLISSSSVSTTSGKDITFERVDFNFEGEFYVPSFIYRPSEVKKKLSAIIISPGWPHHKYIDTYNDFAFQLAKEGFLALILDHAPFGERQDGSIQYLPENSSQSCINVEGAAMLLGICYMGLRVRDNIRAVDYLMSREDIDKERIGITGLCEGGMDTWYSAAIDERMKVVAPLCSCTTYEAWTLEYSNYGVLGDTTQSVYGILKFADMQHIFASIAPRPLLIQNNIKDNWWPISGYNQVVELCNKVFGLYKASEKFDAHLENASHAYHPIFSQRIIEWFKRWL